ncbi:hypothetical protein SNE40_003804 [Patella caerulea]|uniref:Uncharacterized protein n=1 Tax=Patella caerulea TaxID=87958 RepID=A0AAN8K8M5_PATCE
MCPVEVGDYNKRVCVERKCEECGTHKLKSLLYQVEQKDTVSWQLWDSVKHENGTRKELVTESGSGEQFSAEFLKEVEALSLHLHNAKWEHSQFTNLTSKALPKGWVVMVLDFGQNYTCINQDEAQSAHWFHNQVTVHPIVTYYNCQNTHCHEIVKEELVMLSDDLNHDTSAVKAFIRQAEDHLTDKRNLKIEHVVQFSDGCASQYKSKQAFRDISDSTSHSTDRYFFGSRHGKGPCDACVGVVKSSIRNAVLRREVIVQSAEDAFGYCRIKMTRDETDDQCNHSKRTFFLVKNISHRKNSNLMTIVGTRSLHCVASVTGPGDAVWTRNLCCYCDVCIGYESGLCESTGHVDNWTLQPLLQQKKSAIEKSGKDPKVAETEKAPKTAQMQKESKEDNAENKLMTRDENTDVLIIEPEITRQHFFARCTEYLAKCKNFGNLQARAIYFKELDLYQKYTVEVESGVSILKNKLTVDKVALTLHPGQCSFGYPVVVVDGNCLPRSVSVACEEYHEEIRVRIAVEMSCHVEMYTNNDYLC